MVKNRYREISAFTRSNIDNLLYKISDILDNTDPNMLYELDTRRRKYGK